MTQEIVINNSQNSDGSHPEETPNGETPNGETPKGSQPRGAKSNGAKLSGAKSNGETPKGKAAHVTSVTMPNPFEGGELFVGTLVRRYKRFLVDVIDTNGMLVTMFMPNTGSMATLLNDDAPVLYSRASNPKRKYRFTLEFIHAHGGWMGVNTMMTNDIAEYAIANGLLDDFGKVSSVRREYTYRDSRVDFLLETQSHPLPLLVEVKGVSMVHDSVASFPDTKTARGLKHLNTLVQALDDGYRAANLYLIKGNFCKFEVAAAIDAKYAEGFQRAIDAGVEMVFVSSKLDYATGNITLTRCASPFAG